MLLVFPDWLLRASVVIRRRAVEQPGTLFLLLLALNAVARPVSITAHDARLYSLQALNAAEHGAFADDLFLRYGSQDQYSLFSQMVGPIVAVLGVRAAFFGLYLVFNTLFILALFRLVRALIDDALLATLALVFLVTAQLPYGGQGVFMVHEQFFTPRMVGTTLTLFALERMLRHRFVAAIALLLAGAAVHPLMAFGGMMIAVGVLAATCFAQRVCWTLLGGAALVGGLILCMPTLGTKLFGTMDEAWHQQIRVLAINNYPDRWRLVDWLNVAVSFALPLVATVALFRDDPVRRRFLWAAALAGAVGLLATFVASLSPFALLFQAQPYRVLWILKVLQVPLGFLLIARWSQSVSFGARIAALALVAFFCNAHTLTSEWTIMAAILFVSLLHAKMTAPTPKNDWWWYGAARGFVLGAIGCMVYRVWFFVGNRAMFASHFDLNEFVFFDLINPMFWLVGICVFASRKPIESRSLAWTAAGVAALVPSAFFTAEASSTFRRAHTRLGGDIAFVSEVVQQSNVKHPTIYAAIGRCDLLWIDVGANSYFDIVQTAGVMFRRRTAQEIERRAALVAKFEIRLHRDKGVFCNDDAKAGMEKLFRIPFESPPATAADLVALCQEPSLDYVVIPQAFPELSPATNGRVYVYDCAKVRAINDPSIAFARRRANAERRSMTH